jgi:group I intron endonuclease
MIIYKTTNLINEKIYVGQDSKNNPDYLGSGIYLKRAIKKYGKENFKKEIIEHCKTKNELNKREIYWIKKLNAIKKGYNISVGGEGGNLFFGKKHSKEAKLKISEFNKGKKLSNEIKDKIRQSHIGMHHTDETKRKLKLLQLGRVPNAETKRKMTLAHIGMRHTDETKKKMSLSRKGIKLNQSTKDKLKTIYKLLSPNGEIYLAKEGVVEFRKKHKMGKQKWAKFISGEISNYNGWKLLNY